MKVSVIYINIFTLNGFHLFHYIDIFFALIFIVT